MKKLLLVILLTTLSTGMFAGWNTNQRNKCRWYAHRFVAQVHVFTGLYAWQRSPDCDYSYAEKIRDCAWQKASMGWGGPWQSGGVKKRFCSRGEVINSLEALLLPYHNNLEENIEESEFRSESAIFDEASHSIQINGMSGYIKLQKGNGYFSNLRLSVWRPNDDHENSIEDENMDDSEVLNQFEIKVTDKGILFNGKLVSEELMKQFIVTESKDEYYVKFDGIRINIPVDPSISLDDLAVRVDGDAAPDTDRNIDNEIENTEQSVSKGEYKLNVFPNPTADILTIEFSNNLSDGQTVIEIYDSKGEKVKDAFSGDLSKEELKSVKVDLSDLKTGNYFVLIQSNGKKLLRQIVKK